MAASRDVSEMMVSMAALILNDCGSPVSAENIGKVIKAAGGEVEPYWPKLFADAAQGLNISDLMTNVSAAPVAAVPGAAAGGAPAAGAPAAEEKKEEKEEEEEEDEDMGFSLFD